MNADDARTLRALLHQRAVGALGTLHQGDPAVSMVPFVLPAGGTQLFIHVSALAPHTRDMQAHPRVSLLVMAEPGPGVSPQALPRVALACNASFLARGGAEHAAEHATAYATAYATAQAAYLARFPDAATTFELGDFALVALQPVAARLVAGFGRAQALAGDALTAWLCG